MANYFVAVSFQHKKEKCGLVFPYDSSDPHYQDHIEEDIRVRGRVGKIKVHYEGSNRNEAKRAISKFKSLDQLVDTLTDKEVNEILRIMVEGILEVAGK